MGTKRTKYIAATLSLVLATTTLTACASEEESQFGPGEEKQNTGAGIFGSIFGGNDEDSENGDNENDEDNKSNGGNKVIDYESVENRDDVATVAENFYNEVADLEFPPTPENIEDDKRQLTYIEVEELVGEPIFYGEDYPYDVRISLDKMEPNKRKEVVKTLEDKYGLNSAISNYDNLTDSEKILVNTYMGIVRKELALADGIDEIHVNRDDISFNNNNDAIIKTGALYYTTNGSDEKNGLERFPLTLYLNDEGNWVVDMIAFLNHYFNPVDPESIPVEIPPGIMPVEPAI